MPSPHIHSFQTRHQSVLRCWRPSASTNSTVLITDIPEEHRNPALRLPDSASELEVASRMQALAALNQDAGSRPSFLGAGAYRHFIPSTVGAVLQRGEFVTSYTPYQPEAAQGVLQSGFEFQSAVAQIFDMEVANAGMYDGPTAFAEAGLMAARVSRRNRILILDTADRRLFEVAEAYTRYQEVEVEVISRERVMNGDIPDDAACIAFQSPNFLGRIEDVQATNGCCTPCRRVIGHAHLPDCAWDV